MKFTGRIPRAPFDAWAESPDGRAVLDPVQSGMRFALLGRRRAARRLVWRQLNELARNVVVVAAIQREVDAYLTRLGQLVYAHDLPRASVDLHRLVVVPRSFVNSVEYRGIVAAVDGQLPFATADGSELLLDWFVLLVISRIETAIVSARPSPRSPLSLGRDWVTVGVNEQFEWGIPLQGPAWLGHYYVLELTSSALTRSVRKGTEEAIANLEKSLPSLSRVHRNGILRNAGSSLEPLMARA
jgi:hypothetical protein